MPQDGYADASKARTPGRIQFALRQNAYDFLNASMDEAAAAEADGRRWKFAIVHASQTIELLLKARLAQEHEILVRASVDSRSRLTVGFDRAIERLAQCGVTFGEVDLGRLRTARVLRNDIVHYTTSASAADLKAAYIGLFEFVHALHLDEFDEELHDHVDPRHHLAESVLMEAFHRPLTTYQGAEIPPAFAAEIVAAQYDLERVLNGERYRRIPYGDPRDLFPDIRSANCGDCGVRLGQIHVEGCDLEACPRCGLQLLSCSCEPTWPDGEIDRPDDDAY